MCGVDDPGHLDACLLHRLAQIGRIAGVDAEGDLRRESVVAADVERDGAAMLVGLDDFPAEDVGRGLAELVHLIEQRFVFPQIALFRSASAASFSPCTCR